MTTTVQTLARFLHAYPPSPALIQEVVIRVVLDVLGCASAGASTDGGRAAVSAATVLWGRGDAPVWFSKTRLTAPGAAFVNSAYASMLDLDDGHRAAAGHPGAAVIPAVLAVAQARAIAPERVLCAIAIGYEVGVRISAAREFSHLRTTDSGLWCAYAVAAAIGWMVGLSPDLLAHAIAIAGTTGPGLEAAGRGAISSLVKEGIPFAVADGIVAVELAAAGYTGPLDILDAPDLYDARLIVDDLGAAWRIEGVYFKLFSCCRWAHAAIDGVLELQDRHGIEASAIEAIEVATFPRALVLGNQPSPESMEAAQYSIPFSVALALTRGPRALLPLRRDSLDDGETVALAHRVRLSVDSEYENVFPGRVPAAVTIITAQDDFSARIEAPAGDPARPLSLDKLKWKFGILAAERMTQSASTELMTAVLRLPEDGVQPLAVALERGDAAADNAERRYPDMIALA